MVYGFVESLQAPTSATFGVLAGALSVLAYLPYIIAIFQGNTRPERASWFLWSVLGSIAFASQLYEGASGSLAFVAVQVGGTILVSLLSIWRGYGHFWHRRNLVMFAVAAAGIGLWVQLDTSAYALAITIAISLMGGIVTVKKAYDAPGTETLATWSVFLLASLCAVASVGDFAPILLAYPLYLATLYSAVFAALLLGRRRAAANLPFRSVRNDRRIVSLPELPRETVFWRRERTLVRQRARAALIGATRGTPMSV